MNKKNLFPLMILSGAAAMGLLAGCSQSNGDDPNGYTYNTYLSTSPSKWNVHNWETSDESYIQSFTESGLYEVVLNAKKNGYEFVSEMASAMPVQIDPGELSESEYDDLVEKYFPTGNPSLGQIWEIPLRETAKWEDGTPITSADYVESMQLLLDPKYANYRADSYYKGNFVIANAENYYKNGRSVLEPVYQYLVNGGTSGTMKESDGTMVNNSEDFCIDLAKTESPYATSVFSSSGSSDTVTLYTLLNNRSVKSTDAVELAAKRITLGVSYYYWQFVDHSNSPDKDDWANIKKADSVTSKMLESQNAIRIRDFDAHQVMTTASLDSSETTEVYTMAKLQADLATFVNGITPNQAFAKKDWTWKVPLLDTIRHAKDESLTFEKVGIAAHGDHAIRLYLGKSISSLDLKFQLASNWLVNVPLYKKLTKTTQGTSKATSYATASEANYMSYGPYKLTKFLANTQITIERNDQWYGYTDPTYAAQFASYPEEMQVKNQYKMTKINTSIIKTHSTAVSEFMAGRLDDIDLQRVDMATYGQSSRRTTTLESYTQKLSFNTNRSKLLQRQTGDHQNKTALANKNLRMGLSLGLDRDTFAAQNTAGSKAFTGLLNELYLSNVNTGEMYRNTAQGKSVYGQVYGKLGGEGGTSDTALDEKANGYNHSQAVYHLAQGLKEELSSTEEGHLKAGDTLTLEFRVYDDSSDTTIAMHQFISNQWSELFQEACKAIKADSGSASLLAGGDVGIKIQLTKDEDYYTSAVNGAYEMIFSIWGGAAIDPYGLMQVYLDSTFTKNCEYGFKGNQDKEYLNIDLDGDGKINEATERKTYDAWYHEMNDTLLEGEFSDEAKVENPDAEHKEEHEKWKEVHEKRLTILAGTEAGVISRFETIPVVARGTSSLTGFKVENATKSYVNLVGYGGIRFLSFNYNNGEWSQFCKEHNNDLKQLYKTL